MAHNHAFVSAESFEFSVQTARMVNRQVTMVIPHGGMQISICMDNSGGQMRNLARSHLCIFDSDDNNVTAEVYAYGGMPQMGNNVMASADNIRAAMNCIDVYNERH